MPTLRSLVGLANFLPDPIEALPVVGEAPPLEGRELTLLSWNLQYGAGPGWHFFYDGGQDVHVDPARVHRTLAAMVPHLQADVALLQEVDRGSDRTGRIDELVTLGAGFPAWVSACCHRCRWLPHPARAPLGRVDMAVAITSRLALRGARRIALPGLREPALRRWFNLQRCLVEVRLPYAGRELAVATAHLSAFSRGDGTLPAQVAVLAAWMDEQRAAGRPFVLGGDLNLLPPEDDPRRLGPSAVEFADPTPPLLPLLERARRVLPPSAGTYVPPGASAPDRQIDHVLVSPDVEVLSARVLDTGDLSDHRPIWARLRLPA